MADAAHTTIESEIDRRTAIRGLAIGAAAGFVMFERDPILDAIQAYKDGNADYNANAPRDDEAALAYAAQSYEPPMLVLDHWDRPAQTSEGAIAALELAQHEMSQFGENPLTKSMINAAIGFLNA